MIHDYLRVLMMFPKGVKVHALYQETPVGVDVKVARKIIDGMIKEGYMKKGFRSIYVITPKGEQAYRKNKHKKAQQWRS